MSRFDVMYKERLTTAEGIAKLIKSGYNCASPICMGEPVDIVNAIAQRVEKGEISGIKTNGTLTFGGRDYLKPEFEGKFDFRSWFFGAGSRKGGQEGRFDYFSYNYSDYPKIYDLRNDLDAVLMVVSPMDEHGYFSTGPYFGETLGMLRNAKHVYVEVNKFMPRTFGQNFIHISQVEALCEKDEPIFELPVGEPSENDYKIGDLIAPMVPDEATIQIGIGGVSGALGKARFGNTYRNVF